MPLKITPVNISPDPKYLIAEIVDIGK